MKSEFLSLKKNPVQVRRIDAGSQRGPSRNLKVAAILATLVIGMVGLAYAAVPLYQLFCQITGYGGTTAVAKAAPGAVAYHPMTLRFDTNVARDLPWRFMPPEPVDVRLGEERLVKFKATNIGTEPILGTATFNVTPFKVGQYFNKIECFCFTEQLLMPGESKEFPVTFFVDPELADDKSTEDVNTITLSYTFFNKGPEALKDYLNQNPPTKKTDSVSDVVRSPVND